ncbi:hypothetical protein CHH83_10130 [Bacillus sp. 7586-K]|nr:hypothetical protein CHH83_10130 [Bacillus sp. 7586-K]
MNKFSPTIIVYVNEKRGIVLNEFQKRTIYYSFKRKKGSFQILLPNAGCNWSRNERPAKVPQVIWGSLDRADVENLLKSL